jgi:paxillin
VSDDPLYHQQFAPKCHHCSTPIIDQRFITIDDPNFGKRFYHELHFFCGECGIPFLDPSQSSSAGTEVRGNGDKDGPAYEEEQTAAFVIHGKHAFCPECDIKLHRPKCKGCRKPIRSEDEALEALKGTWHRNCFKCTVSKNLKR